MKWSGVKVGETGHGSECISFVQHLLVLIVEHGARTPWCF
jgi:hypothetical protein